MRRYSSPNVCSSGYGSGTASTGLTQKTIVGLVASSVLCLHGDSAHQGSHTIFVAWKNCAVKLRDCVTHLFSAVWCTLSVKMRGRDVCISCDICRRVPGQLYLGCHDVVSLRSRFYVENVSNHLLPCPSHTISGQPA